MDVLLEFISRGYVPLVANIGLLALLAWMVTLFGRYLFVESRNPGPAASGAIGVVFGLATGLLMVLPIEIEPGIFGDARGAPVLMSGIIGGPVAAAVTGTLAAAVRLYIGGPGAASGSLFIAAFAVSGVLWQIICARRGRTSLDIIELVLVVTITVAATAPLAFMFPPDKQFPILISLWPQLWVANVAGIVILSTLVKREYQRRQAEEQLINERARAEREADARTRFLNAMSHEMRTPLNGILGIIQLLQNKSLPADARRDLNIASDSGKYLLTLINQVLDIAKLDAGKTIITMEPFTAAALVDNLYSMFKYQSDGKGLEFRQHLIGDSETPLLGDFEHIRQVLFNILGNAIKFTKTGNIDILARVQGQGPRRLLRIEVSDTGPGIPADQLELIFGEFQQTEVGRDTRGSTGLGLSICRQLTEAMGARLWAESVEGAGSTFVFEIDLEVTDALTQMPTVADAANTGAVAPLRVLVAEDNAINQMVVRGMLEQEGHTVVIADNGMLTVENMRNHPGDFDLILMDIQMPEMNGLEATRAIRQLPDIPADFPIIALTANAFTNQRDEFIDAGMDDVLTKPLRIEDLRQRLALIVGTADTDAGDTGAGPSATHSEMKTPPADPASAGDGMPRVAARVRELLEYFDAARFRTMLEEFEVSSADLFRSIRKSDGDVSRRNDAAHQLAGMAANLGFEDAADVLRRIERENLDAAELEECIDKADNMIVSAMKVARETVASAG